MSYNQITVRRLPQFAVEQTARYAGMIKARVRLTSPALTTACRQAGLPLELAELCGGLLASLTEDMMEVSRLPKNDLTRSKRLERILEAVQEPQSFALKLAIAASPLNGKAAVRHWDVICPKAEIGKLAWLLNMDTENAYKYGRKLAKREQSGANH